MIKKVTAKDVSRFATPATDKTIMPFGKHEGLPLESVPASYLVWFYEQDWAEEKYPEIYLYCKEKEFELYDETLEDDYPFNLGGDDY